MFGRMASSGLMENVIHASSDLEEAEREIRLWFKPAELLRTLGPGTDATAAPQRARRSPHASG
jgi:nucleoside-diphosphate kinase